MPPPVPPVVQSVSVGGIELGRGIAVLTPSKSAAVLLVSSAGSSAVGQPAVILRRQAPSFGGPAIGVPAGEPSTADPGPARKLMQSIASQQTAPPAPFNSVLSSGKLRSAFATDVSPIRIVDWFAPFGTLAVNVWEVGTPALSKTVRV